RTLPLSTHHPVLRSPSLSCLYSSRLLRVIHSFPTRRSSDLGVCHFCQKNVQFIIKHDPNALFQFASLQSPIGKKLLDEFNVPPQDRKSTRLNSSHVSISYAVFCLKKKTTYDRRYQPFTRH